MAKPALSEQDEGIKRPDTSHLITEDDAPVENWFQERQQRLLPDSLYASWPELGRTESFLAAADVGLFHKLSEQATVPDVMVSLDVEVPEDWWEDHNRSYMIWEFGKAPEIVIEIVSNKVGGEEQKFERYARAGVPYYAIYDPRLFIGKRPLRVYILHGGTYVEVLEPSMLEALGLGLALWEGTYEGLTATWLRWCDQDGTILQTGLERAECEKNRADREQERADQAQERAAQAQTQAEHEKARADRLADRLREMGLDPEL